MNLDILAAKHANNANELFSI